ncbi:HesB/YadR/YfhF family protein [Paenibacillus sp. FJAT-26967]|uniref:HesB/YadR/YfhF family protein n=1 Tax=Paenibacillus sp. FJAT-26967 TaxID=1729690 RepID=UPI000838376D|nr:Fe-S cluster assembly protein HesB [Paenibacillus sp. FJAT-26967]
MGIRVSAGAIACFKGDWGFQNGDQVRIFVRYSGGGEDAFTFGIMKDSPHYPGMTAEEDGISFFMEQSDIWYLEGRDLVIDGNGEDISISRV